MSEQTFNEPRIALNRIYTRRGDAGQTQLAGGQVLSKDDLRIESYGTVDELNAFIGAARTTAEELGARQNRLLEFALILNRHYFSPGNFLSGETEEIDFGGGEMPFAREQLPGSYILEMVDVPEARFVYSDPPSGRDVVMDLTAVPYLTLWSDGGPFLCIEPCWGLTDRHEQRSFEEKDGIQRISPNEQLSAHFSMRPQLARPR